MLFLLSGDAQKILAAHSLPDSTLVEPFSEKELVTPLATLRRLRQAKGKIFFGTKVLRLQRYRLMIKLFLFLAGKLHAAIIDEAGDKEMYSFWRFIFADIWKLFAETIASAFVVLETYLELESLKRRNWLIK